MPHDPRPLGERNYQGFAARYARHAEHKPFNALYDRPHTLSLLPADLRGARALDAGCGPGFYAEALLARGAEVVCVDVTPAMVALARDRLGERATVLRADLEQPLDFAADASFDVVLCPLVLDYIADLGALHAEFYRVLRPGGVLVVSAGHPLSDWLWARRHVEGHDGAYGDTELTTAAWSGFGDAPVEITAYRRPFSAHIEPLLRAGLRLERVLEPGPTPALTAQHPEIAARLRQMPAFMMLRARRPLPPALDSDDPSVHAGRT